MRKKQIAATGMAADEEDTSKGHVRNDLMLPVSRIRVIMKSSPDVENIGYDASYAITYATVCMYGGQSMMMMMNEHLKNVI